MYHSTRCSFLLRIQSQYCRARKLTDTNHAVNGINWWYSQVTLAQAVVALRSNSFVHSHKLGMSSGLPENASITSGVWGESMMLRQLRQQAYFAARYCLEYRNAYDMPTFYTLKAHRYRTYLGLPNSKPAVFLERKGYDIAISHAILAPVQYR